MALLQRRHSTVTARHSYSAFSQSWHYYSAGDGHYYSVQSPLSSVHLICNQAAVHVNPHVVLRCYQTKTYRTSRNGLFFHSFVLQVTPIIDETIRQLIVTPSQSIIVGWHFYSAFAASEGGVSLLTSTLTAPDLKITASLKKHAARKTRFTDYTFISLVVLLFALRPLLNSSEIQGPHIVHLQILNSYPHPPIHERSQK